MRIELIQADITSLKIDVIVNAANTSLLGGGGVDGAIHRAAGVQLLEECKTLMGCKTGEAKITKGYNLPAKYVIHTVGPVWNGGSRNEKELLSDCYYNSMALAKKYNCSNIAFPNISTGVYRFPKKMASEIAVKVVKYFLNENLNIKKVYFVCFDRENYEIYKNIINE